MPIAICGYFLYIPVMTSSCTGVVGKYIMHFSDIDYPSVLNALYTSDNVFMDDTSIAAASRSISITIPPFVSCISLPC